MKFYFPSPAGFNPVWNETLNFVIHTPELALVRFVVEDYDKASRNDFIGQFTLPFTCIQAGEQRVQGAKTQSLALKPPDLQLTAVFIKYVDKIICCQITKFSIHSAFTNPNSSQCLSLSRISSHTSAL